MEKQFFSYIRVSTTKQGEHGVSLREQQDSISRYAQHQSMCIMRSFEEQETAAKRGRPVFSEMLRLLKRGAAHGVVIHKIDRGARNLKDWADLAELIDAGVEVHFANESLDLNTRGGRLSADIQAVVAADFIRNLREETKKGFYGRLKQGLYPIRAPIGYLDCGGGQAKTPDPKMAPLVREAFERYATGSISQPRLVEEMYRRGLRNRGGKKISLNGISTMLNNPFYMGLIRIKKTGQCYPGIHVPILSKQLFDTVQQVLSGKAVPRTHKHDFTFSRMVRCQLCGSAVMAELQKGHIYYRCHTKACATKTIREERINSALDAAFAPLHLNEEEAAYIKQWFAWARSHKQERKADLLEACRLQLSQLHDRLSRLTDAFLDGAIDKALHAERRAGLIVEETSLKQKMRDLDAGTDTTLPNLEKYLELIQSAPNLHKMTLPLEKRALVKMLTSNLSVGPENPTITLQNEAQLIANRPKVLSGSPNRGVPRTWNALLRKLAKQFERENGEARFEDSRRSRAA
jgi:DNA invertase Pin-like site-specific DNA recombinase